MLNLFRRYRVFAFSLLALLVLLPFLVLAEDTLLKGYQIVKNKISLPIFWNTSDSATSVATTSVGTCIRNTSTSNDYFVPTRTWTEWSTFVSNMPGVLSLLTCCGDGACQVAQPDCRDAADNSVSCSGSFDHYAPVAGENYEFGNYQGLGCALDCPAANAAPVALSSDGQTFADYVKVELKDSGLLCTGDITYIVPGSSNPQKQFCMTLGNSAYPSGTPQAGVPCISYYQVNANYTGVNLFYGKSVYDSVAGKYKCNSMGANASTIDFLTNYDSFCAATYGVPNTCSLTKTW